MLINQLENGKKEVVAFSTDKAAEGQLAKTPFTGVYHLKVIYRIHGMESFKINTILDTVATKCCVSIKSVPAEPFEDSKWSISVWGIAS